MLDRLYGHVLSALNVIASLLIASIMVIVTVDVIGRGAFNAPLTGVPELVKVSVVAIVWLQMAYTLRADRHLKSNLIFDMLPRRGKKAVYLLNCVLGFAVFAIIVHYTYDDVLKTFQRGTFEGEHPMRIPVWPVWLILVIGATLTAIEFAIQAIKTIVTTDPNVVRSAYQESEVDAVDLAAQERRS